MFMRHGPGFVLWTLIVGCGVAVTGTWVLASQDATTRPAAEAPETPPALPPADPSVDREMAAFERRARVDMILYTGRFGRTDLAAARNQLEAIAVTLKTGSK